MHGGGFNLKSRKRQKLVLVREPNGRASRSTGEREYEPTRIKRLLDASMAGMADPEWATAIGRLYIRQKITAPMYAAGKRWARGAERYQQAIGAPPPDAKGLSFEGKKGGTPPDPDSKKGKEQAVDDKQATTDFLAAHAVLLASGLIAEQAVRRACEDDHSPESYYELNALNRGLLWLAQFWDLTSQEKKNVR